MLRLKFLLRCAASIALIIFAMHKVSWAKLGLLLGQINPVLALPASSLVLLMIASLAFRWRIFLNQQGLEFPFSTIFSLTWAGQFFNSVLPGSTGGDVVKIYQLCRLAPNRKAAAAATVVVDRFSALFALAILVVISLVIDPVPLQEIVTFAGSMKIAILCFIAVVAIGTLAAWILFLLVRSTHWPVRLQRTLAALKKNLAFNRNLLTAMSVSIGIHCLNFFIVFLFARALGIRITYFQILLIFPVVLLLVMLPVTVNGHGLRELLMIFYFNHLHITLSGNTVIGVRETVVALSMVCVANDLLWSAPGGVWYLLRFKRASHSGGGRSRRQKNSVSAGYK